MEQPPHFVEPGMESKVCKLQKSIYGLKQAPRCWYLTRHKYLVEVGFVRCAQEVCLYIKRVVLLSVYVDDITVTGNDNDEIVKAYNALKNKFQMTDLDKLKSILGIKVHIPDKVVLMNQQGYIKCSWTSLA
jgi:Reverse transcriptase (RNA-dependent DNA polymerase)